MTQQEMMMKILVLESDLRHAKEGYDKEIYDMKEEMIGVKKRLTAYDLLTAKWGGFCMLAVVVGSGAMYYSEKIFKVLKFIISVNETK